jgi:hypothetical protein
MPTDQHAATTADLSKQGTTRWEGTHHDERASKQHTTGLPTFVCLSTRHQAPTASLSNCGTAAKDPHRNYVRGPVHHTAAANSVTDNLLLHGSCCHTGEKAQALLLSLQPSDGRQALLCNTQRTQQRPQTRIRGAAANLTLHTHSAACQENRDRWTCRARHWSAAARTARDHVWWTKACTIVVPRAPLIILRSCGDQLPTVTSSPRPMPYLVHVHTSAANT